jgi:hypothetical protein
MTNRCIIIFEKRLDAYQLKKMKKRIGAKILRRLKIEPAYIKKCLEFYRGIAIPSGSTFYEALDYKDVLLLSLSDPKPLFMYREDSTTEETLNHFWFCQWRYTNIPFKINDLCGYIKGVNSILSTISIVPNATAIEQYFPIIKEAIASDISNVTYAGISYLNSIEEK